MKLLWRTILKFLKNLKIDLPSIIPVSFFLVCDQKKLFNLFNLHVYIYCTYITLAKIKTLDSHQLVNL